MIERAHELGELAWSYQAEAEANRRLSWDTVGLRGTAWAAPQALKAVGRSVQIRDVHNGATGRLEIGAGDGHASKSVVSPGLRLQDEPCATCRRDVAHRSSSLRSIAGSPLPLHTGPALSPTPSPPRPPGRSDPDALGQVPLLGRFFPAPVAAKVPEIIFVFWVVKILTTAGGEATSDYLKKYGNFGGGGTEIALFVIGIVLQFSTRRYRAFSYWFLAFAIAIAGTGFSDFLHLDVHIPYAGTSLLWAVVLAGVFWTWQRSEGTLSIHSVTTQRREVFYWAVVFATFALGTALGDFTATSLNMGYLPSGLFFFGVILLPLLAWWRFGLNPVAAFWMAYVVTRPLGASFADYFSKPSHITGIGFGDGPTALVFAVAVLILVVYLAIARPDIQRTAAPATEDRMVSARPERGRGEPRKEAGIRS